MTGDRENGSLPEHESKLMESLLHHALGDDQEKLEQRIERLNASIRSDRVSRVEPRRGLLRRAWFPLSAAAAVLLATLLVASLSPRNEALAAIERSLRAEKLPIDRQYEVAITMRDGNGATRKVLVDLYVRQDKVLIHTSSQHPIGEARIYVDGDSQWIVPVSDSPLRAPLATVRDPMIGRPPLVISTILRRLRVGHDLELQPTQLLDGLHALDPLVVCDHVVAVRRVETSSRFPQRVEFWSDTTHGMVYRLTAQFGVTDLSDVTMLSAQLKSTADLPDDFFDYEPQDSSDHELEAVSEPPASAATR